MNKYAEYKEIYKGMIKEAVKSSQEASFKPTEFPETLTYEDIPDKMLRFLGAYSMLNNHNIGTKALGTVGGGGLGALMGGIAGAGAYELLDAPEWIPPLLAALGGIAGGYGGYKAGDSVGNKINTGIVEKAYRDNPRFSAYDEDPSRWLADLVEYKKAPDKDAYVNYNLRGADLNSYLALQAYKHSKGEPTSLEQLKTMKFNGK